MAKFLDVSNLTEAQVGKVVDVSNLTEVQAEEIKNRVKQFEDSNKPSIERRFLQLIKNVVIIPAPIDGILYFVKDGMVIFESTLPSNEFFVDSEIWYKFKNEYYCSDDEVVKIIKKMMDKHFGFHDVNPYEVHKLDGIISWHNKEFYKYMAECVAQFVTKR